MDTADRLQWLEDHIERAPWFLRPFLMWCAGMLLLILVAVPVVALGLLIYIAAKIAGS